MKTDIMKQEKNEFEKACYDAYRTLWLLRHGLSVTELMRRLTDHAVVELREMPIEDQSNETHVRAFMDSLADCLWTDCFETGCVYKNEDSFLSGEYLDPEYMEHLFAFMPGDKDALFSSWYALSGVRPKEEKLEVETPAGMIRAYKNTDPGQPGILIQVQPEGYDPEIDVAEACVYTNREYAAEERVTPRDVVIHAWDDATKTDTNYTGVIRRKDIFYGPGSVYDSAWKVGKHGFLHLQSCEDGWDYTIYSHFYEEIDGGVIEDPDLGPLEARDQILEDQGWQDCDLKEVDTEELEENVEGAN